MLNVLSGYVLFPALEKAAKRVITPKVQELHAFAQLSNQEQLLAQKKHLHEMLVYCQKNVPYYQDLFALHQFSPDRVLTDIKYDGGGIIHHRRELQAQWRQPKGIFASSD